MSVRRLDSTKPIIEIIWEGIVSPEHVEQANTEIQRIAEQLGSSFDVLVDMRNMKAFLRIQKKNCGAPETTDAMGYEASQCSRRWCDRQNAIESDFQRIGAPD